MPDKNIIKQVLPDSIAEELGVESGDVLISINNQQIIDAFDYRFLIKDEEITVCIKKSNGQIWELEIEKEVTEDLGIIFNNDLIDEEKSCRNKCIFCFIDQLPKGMRKTLYFKDDDSRLSFLFGNYITMTNMEDWELERIVKYRMSPVNISVHAVRPDIRKMMLNNKNAGNLIERIKYLVDNGIEINCQIVLVRDVNDKEILEETINELSKFYPYMHSVSIVPVGITKYREGLFKVKPFDKESAQYVINQVEKIQDELISKYGSRIVYLSDEFYILALSDNTIIENTIPKISYYEDFPQIENGVGMIRNLIDEFFEELEKITDVSNSSLSIVTGVSSYKYIKYLVNAFCEKHNKTIHVYKIINRFFGETITVTGLLTGQDIISQLKDRELGEKLLICENMLKADEDIFLDDISLSDIEKALNIKIVKVKNSGKDLVNKLI